MHGWWLDIYNVLSELRGTVIMESMQMLTCNYFSLFAVISSLHVYQYNYKTPWEYCTHVHVHVHFISFMKFCAENL